MTSEAEENNEQDVNEQGLFADSIGNFLEIARRLFKKVVVFVSFGPGVLGVLWLIGLLFKR